MQDEEEEENEDALELQVYGWYDVSELSELLLRILHFVLAIVITVLILENKENCDLYSKYESTCHTVAIINGGFFVMFWVFYFFTMHVHGIRGVNPEDTKAKRGDGCDPCIQRLNRTKKGVCCGLTMLAFGVLIVYLIPLNADWQDTTAPSLHVWTITHRVLAGLVIMSFIRLIVASCLLYEHYEHLCVPNKDWVYFFGAFFFWIFAGHLFVYDVMDRSTSNHEPSKPYYHIMFVSGVLAVAADIVYYVWILYLIAKAKGVGLLFRHRNFWRVMLWFVLLLVLVIVTIIPVMDYHDNYNDYRDNCSMKNVNVKRRFGRVPDPVNGGYKDLLNHPVHGPEYVQKCIYSCQGIDTEYQYPSKDNECEHTLQKKSCCKEATNVFSLGEFEPVRHGMLDALIWYNIVFSGCSIVIEALALGGILQIDMQLTNLPLNRAEVSGSKRCG